MGKQRKLSVQERELIDRVSIDVYFNKYVVPYKKGLHNISDINNTSICPFHNEADPSFHYWVKHKLFHCFGCGASGDVIAMHQKVQAMYHNNFIDRKTAINELIALFGLQGIIKEVEAEAEQPKTIFEQIKERYIEGMQYTIPKDTLTINKFRVMNERLNQMNIPTSTKVKEYAELDMMACLVISEAIEN